MEVVIAVSPTAIRAVLEVWRLGSRKNELDEPFPEPNYIEIVKGHDHYVRVRARGDLETGEADHMVCEVYGEVVEASVPFTIESEFRDTMGTLRQVRKIEGMIKKNPLTITGEEISSEFTLDVISDIA